MRVPMCVRANVRVRARQRACARVSATVRMRVWRGPAEVVVRVPRGLAGRPEPAVPLPPSPVPVITNTSHHRGIWSKLMWAAT